MNNNNNNTDERKQLILDKLQKVIKEEKEKENKQEQQQDIKPTLIDNTSYNNLENDIKLEKRRLELEKEINEINELLQQKNTILGKNETNKKWYSDNTTLNSIFTHPDFLEWQKLTSIMTIVGLVMGGLHGFSQGRKYIRDSIAKSVHNPLSVSSIQLNQKQTLGIMVFRSSLIFSYRCGLYTSTFLGVEYLLKNNVFGNESMLNKTLAGTAIGVLSAFHMRKRGNMVIPVSLFMGTSIGFATASANLLVDKLFRKYDELNPPK